MPRPVDILHVSAGTTGGWRVNDESLRRAVEELGATIERTAIRRPAGGIIRGLRSPATDLRDAAELVAAAERGLDRVRPTAIIYSSSHAALLQPRRRQREAVWIDGAIGTIRPGKRNVLLRALERKRQGRLDLVLAMSLQHPEVLAQPLRPRAVVGLHTPVEPCRGDGTATLPVQPPFGITYGTPKKGIDIAVRAWRLASPGIPLVITGIDTPVLRRYLNEDPPTNVIALGRVSRRVHRALVNQARVYVSASRREEYGTAQMEALGDGIPLAAVPSAGLPEPVAVARQLNPPLVADRISATELARQIDRALSFSDTERDRYAAQARELLRDYSYAEFKNTLATSVLPRLLG